MFFHDDVGIYIYYPIGLLPSIEGLIMAMSTDMETKRRLLRLLRYMTLDVSTITQALILIKSLLTQLPQLEPTLELLEIVTILAGKCPSQLEKPLEMLFLAGKHDPRPEIICFTLIKFQQLVRSHPLSTAPQVASSLMRTIGAIRAITDNSIFLYLY